MLTLFKKKKLTEDTAANVFVNSVLQLVDNGFPEVAQVINESPEFEISPNIDPEDSSKFLLIVFSGNLQFIPQHFETYQDMRIVDLAYRKFSQALGIELAKLKKVVAQYQNYMMRMNHPSKNVHYAMSKAVFFKYHLTGYQEEYFVGMDSPNPILLKRLDEVMGNFIFDWNELNDNFRVVE